MGAKSDDSGPVMSAMEPTEIWLAVTPGAPDPPALPEEPEVELEHAPATTASAVQASTTRTPRAMDVPLSGERPIPSAASSPLGCIPRVRGHLPEHVVAL